MKEIIELRIPENNAKAFLPPDVGVGLGEFIGRGPSVRKVVLAVSDPLVAKIKNLEREFQSRGESFYSGWELRRTYTRSELESARCFLMNINCMFEPAGEECGTVYDESGACEYCGSGAHQVSALILDPKSLPKRSNLAIAKTIAREIIVTAKFVEVFRTNGFSGGEFLPLKQRKKRLITIPGWFQLRVTSTPLVIVAPTRAGIKPLDEKSECSSSHNSANILEQLGIDNASWCDKQGEYRCPLGHTIGLNLLSELSVQEGDFDDSDIACTAQRVGVRRGLLRPEPLLVISPRLRQLLLDHGLKGMNFEIVHLKP